MGLQVYRTMASVDENPGNDSSKKRAAARQISKDDDPDAEDEVPIDGATFKKASDDVLASRRIVKVRRTGGTTAPAPTPAAANPFASIRLVPPQPSSNEAQPEVASEGDTHEDKAKDDVEQSISEAVTHPVLETAAETVTSAETESVPAGDSTKASTDGVVNEELVGNEEPVVNEVASAKVAVDAVNGEPVVIDAASEKVSAVGASGLSSETFQQLSSAKNAFSGSFGTGFSATSTTSGSTQGASTTGFTGGFSFASGPAASPFHSSVFEKPNGNTTFQLFGSGPAAPTPPASSTLQEVHVESGEEREKTVFAADAALFEFLDGGWNERGKGEIKVNVPEDLKRRPRLVMRSKGNLRLLLNANILPNMKITKMDNRGVTFVCANAVNDGKVGLATYALKLRDAQIARDFLSNVEAKKGTGTEPRTPDASPKAVEEAPKHVATET